MSISSAKDFFTPFDHLGDADADDDQPGNHHDHPSAGPSFLYTPDDDRLIERMERAGRITDVFPSDAGLPRRQVVLISWTGETLDALAVMVRGGRVANYKVRVRIAEHTELDPPVSLDDLVARMPKRYGRRLEKTLGAGGQLPPATGAAVGTALRELDERAGRAWDETARRVALQPSPLWPEGDDAVPVLAYERDALGLALTMAGLDRDEVLRSWDEDTAVHFLEGVGGIPLSEDQAIVQDAQLFGDWPQLAPGPIAARFEKGQRTLSVFVANRVALEHVLGVDLIYYSHDFDSYVLVQYKRMRRRSGSRWEYRPDANLASELRRMRKAAKLVATTTKGGPLNYRFGANFCFLKFCEGEAQSISSTELARGLYIPLGLWDMLRSGRRLRGPRGGTAVTYDNVGRWINNTLFIELVDQCWVGTSGLTSDKVGDIVKTALRAKGMVVMVAGRRAGRERARSS